MNDLECVIDLFLDRYTYIPYIIIDNIAPILKK